MSSPSDPLNERDLIRYGGTIAGGSILGGTIASGVAAATTTAAAATTAPFVVTGAVLGALAGLGVSLLAEAKDKQK